MSRSSAFTLLTIAVALAACAGPQQRAEPAPRAPGAPAGQTSGQALPSRTLSFGVRYEVPDLSDKVSSGITAGASKRFFNAALAYVDGKGAPQPYLAEALPQLNTDSWRVSPDGRMETTYRLRPGLTWHDGTPLVAEDFVLAWRVYTSPGMGIFDPVPQNRMEEVVATDPRTLLIRWSTPYPEAGSLRASDLEPLPRHILSAPLAAVEEDPSAQDAFASHAYWSVEFIGAGPYRLQTWEPGSHIEGTAFDGHALGRPKIDRVIVKFMADENTMLSNLLAQGVDIAMDNSLRFEQAVVLKREWADNRGMVLLDPVQPRFTNVQYRPELVSPRGILDLRVRRALAHSVDKEGVMEGLFGGEVPPSDQFLPRSIPYFADLDRAITKYPFDLRRTEQLVVEAGLRKGSDDGYVDGSGERFSFEHWVLSGSQNERQGSIMADGWRRAGFEVREHAIPAAQGRDGQVRASFPALSSVATGGGEGGLNFLTTTQIPRPENRWRGNNRGAWVNEDYDRLWDAFQSTLDRAERTEQAIQMMRLATDNVAMIFLFHSPNVTGHWAKLSGPALGAPDSLINWNVHEWELR